MGLPLEAVPNFSEGRDEATLAALAEPLDGEGVRLLDVHADADHNRSVFTLVGEEGPLQDALVAAVGVARDRIDLQRHDGVHPRVGAADVVPVVPLRPGDMPRAKRTARLIAKRITAELGVTTFLYAEVGEGHGPAFFRRGGLVELQRRLDAGELEPAYGSPDLDPSAGAALVGARRPLIAFNVNLRGAGLEVAREIAGAVREAGGGFRGVRALGLQLRAAGHAQVSMNVEDWEAAALHDILRRIEEEAHARGAEVAGSELVGLMPAGAAAAAAGSALRIHGFDASRLVELRLLEDAGG